MKPQPDADFTRLLSKFQDPAVGGRVIASIQAAMLCFGMIPIGGLSPATPGATLLSTKDDISKDEPGLDTARKLGARMADFALRGMRDPERGTNSGFQPLDVRRAGSSNPRMDGALS